MYNDYRTRLPEWLLRGAELNSVICQGEFILLLFLLKMALGFLKTACFFGGRRSLVAGVSDLHPGSIPPPLVNKIYIGGFRLPPLMKGNGK